MKKKKRRYFIMTKTEMKETFENFDYSELGAHLAKKKRKSLKKKNDFHKAKARKENAKNYGTKLAAMPLHWFSKNTPATWKEWKQGVSISVLRAEEAANEALRDWRKNGMKNYSCDDACTAEAWNDDLDQEYYEWEERQREESNDDWMRDDDESADYDDLGDEDWMYNDPGCYTDDGDYDDECA